MQNILKIVIPSIPFLFIFSIFFLEVGLLIITLTGLFLIFKNKNFELFNNYFFKIIICFSIYLFLSSIFIHEIKDGYKYSYFYSRYIIYIVIISYFIDRFNLKNIFLKSFLIANLLLIFDALFQFSFGFNIIGLKTLDIYRVSSFFGDELILGGFILRISPLVFAFFFISRTEYLTTNNKGVLYIFPLLIILNLIVILISGERAALFLYILFCFYLFVFLKFKKRFKFIFLAALIFFSSTIVLSNKNIYERIINKTIFEVFGYNKFTEKYYVIEELITKDYYKNNCDKENKKNISEKCKNKKKIFLFSPTHNNYYLTSINIFLDHKIFGSGPKSFRILCSEDKYMINKYSCATHTHNYYIQLISETGIIGFLFILLFYSYFLILLRKVLINQNLSNNQHNFYIILLGGLLINFFPIIPTGNFFNNWLSLLIYMPISLLIIKDSNAIRN